MPSLFSPIKVGPYSLKHRVVLAPLTRVRATNAPGNVPQNPPMKEYYSQRGSVPGTLLITEATFIAAKAGIYRHAPGIFSNEQIASWKEITEAVHEKGSYIFLQLWALGRAADVEALHAYDPSYPFVSSSDIPLSSKPDLRPRPLTIEEIKEYIQLYATAASNAVHKAGFDGVEIHGANGYLIDQFTQDVSNKRTDEYGGSTLLERKGLASGLGLGHHFKASFAFMFPYIQTSHLNVDMCMEDPIPTFSYLASELKTRFPNFAYLHVIEARVSGGNSTPDSKDGSNDFLRDIWLPKPFISAGNYDRDTAIKCAEQREGQMIAFGRHFIANPDLPRKLEKDIPLTPYDRSTFYLPGDTSGRGYTDYPFAEEAKF
ncbi:hypothetical protein VKT23_010894 [Stygiomarasmius scandens]|uniref:NADH:flavin oxidoreductase/NADH oxidase N-terminal domain-containing protein n=1 Tax=Marasmiellus scandens TaxID=2682957 RepID=A0ABR1JD61_9AGAR